MLSEINRYADIGDLKEFSLTYITKNGKRVQRKRMTKSGYIKSETKASYANRSNPNIKELGLLHVFNIELNRPETPDIALITHFNGIRVWH